MPSQCYKLKITSAFNSRVYRIVEISGNRTFADLSDIILDTFEFDHSHLYMFSLTRKPYDSNGIYHPMSKEKNCANQIRLQDVNPVVRNKYLYLYDFGDDWMFYITVMGIRDTDREIATEVLESKGNLCQYPSWEEEEYFEDDDWEFEETLSSDEEDPEESEDLVITVYEESDDIVKDRLIAVPARLQRLWIMLAEKDLSVLGEDTYYLLSRLEEAGLVDVDESEDHLYLHVTCGKMSWRDYEFLHDYENRYKFEQILLSLAGIYGVIEKDILYEIFCETLYEGAAVPANTAIVFEQVTEMLARWKFWNRMKSDDGITYISSFCESITEEILARRAKYPVKYYCTLEKKVQDLLVTGDWKSAFPVCEIIFYRLVGECRWNPESAEEFMGQLQKCVAMGYTEQEYFNWIRESFDENKVCFTKRIRKMLLEFRNEFPSAALKGYTWGEYEKNRKDGYHQLSLFDDELPFQ